jgi:hypothetical protein
LQIKKPIITNTKVPIIKRKNSPFTNDKVSLVKDNDKVPIIKRKNSPLTNDKVALAGDGLEDGPVGDV